MPNGPTHRKLTKVAFSIAAVPVWAFAGNTEAMWFSAGVFTTLYFDPDLDLRHRLGFAGNAMGLDLYQKLIPHRAGITASSWREFSKRDWWKLFVFSHLPFVGTLPRTIIVALPFFFLYLLFSAVDSFPLYGIIWLYLGMSYSDIWHVGADLICSDFKRRRTKWSQNPYPPIKEKTKMIAFSKESGYPIQGKAKKNLPKNMSMFSRKKE